MTFTCNKCHQHTATVYADQKNNVWLCQSCEEKKRKKEQKAHRYPHLEDIE